MATQQETVEINILPNRAGLSVEQREFMRKVFLVESMRTLVAERCDLSLDQVLGLENGQLATDSAGWEEIGRRMNFTV